MTPSLRMLLCLAALSAAPYAQDRPLAPTDAGTVQPFVFHAIPSNIRESKVTPADVKASEATARKVASLIAEVPALNPPRGFHSLLSGVLMGRDPTQARLRPVAPLDIGVEFAAPRALGDETFGLDFWINDLRPVILDHLGVRKWEDTRGDFYLEPAATGEVGANLGLFKPELPRSAIQLITVENINYCRRDVASQKQKTVYGCAANLDVVRQLDWQRVAALLEK